MNCFEARKIPIPDFLIKLGFHPLKTNGNDLWYHSPFRQEKKPSFKVNLNHRNWHDFGEGTHGDIIDLGVRLFNCSISEFLDRLASDFPNIMNYAKSAARYNKVQIETESGIKNIVITELTDLKLIDYLTKTRLISLNNARKFCKQVKFNAKNKEVVAIGFQNKSGGYALRNSWYKGNSSPNDISLIKNESDLISVFEGFIDFLSLLELHLCEFYSSDYIILNTTHNLGKTRELIKSYKYVHLYFDNDPAGSEASESVKSMVANPSQIDDRRYLYPKHNDLNELLVSKKLYNRKDQGLSPESEMRL